MDPVKNDMDTLDTVFIQLFHYQADAVRSRDLVTGSRKAVEMLDDKAAKRIVVIRFQIQPKLIVQVIQVGRALYNILMSSQFFYVLFFILVILVMNLPYNFLEDIFQCDEAGRLAVFVENDRDVEFGLPHFDKELGIFLYS